MANSKKNSRVRLLAEMTALQRVLISVIITAIVFFIVHQSHPGAILGAVICWISFALSYVITSWIMFFIMPVNEIKKKANKEDGSRLFVLVIIIVSCFVSLGTVLLLMLAASEPGNSKLITASAAVGGMVLSWVMVHTVFTFHYAHLFYFDDIDDSGDAEPLEFPGKQAPDYIDFAYFSFVIGMTFQVSDVEINSRIVRRTALLHGLLSFAINTFVVALTINFIAGLKK